MRTELPIQDYPRHAGVRVVRKRLYCAGSGLQSSEPEPGSPFKRVLINPSTNSALGGFYKKRMPTHQLQSLDGSIFPDSRIAPNGTSLLRQGRISRSGLFENLSRLHLGADANLSDIR